MPLLGTGAVALTAMILAVRSNQLKNKAIVTAFYGVYIAVMYFL